MATVFFCGLLAAQEIPGGGTSGHSATSLYRELRAVGLDADHVYRVRDASLDREDIHLSLNRGVIAFTRAIDGRITGAFFEGEGEVLLSPPDRVERAQLGLFTGAAILDEHFTTAYLRFNDDTRAELEPALRPLLPEQVNGKPHDDEDLAPGDESAPFDRPAFVTRGESVCVALAPISALRLLITFVNAETLLPNGDIKWQQPPHDQLLHARLAGTRFGVFDILFDTQMAEQIAVIQPTEFRGMGINNVWTSFPMRSARARVTATKGGAPPSLTARTQTAAEQVTNPWQVSQYKIRAEVRPPRELRAETDLELQVTQPAGRILVFELSRYLKVREVSSGGSQLEFVQNEALEGSQLAQRGNDLIAVILPAPSAPGTPVGLHFKYAGDVLSDAGGGLLWVGARGTWYPNLGFAMSGFDLEFHYPPEWTLIATGKRVAPSPADTRAGEEAAELTARFVSERPLPVAGFNLGRYVKAEANAGSVVVDAYASRNVETSLQHPQETVVVQVPVDPDTGHTIGAPIAVTTLSPQPAAHVQKLAAHTAATIDFLAARLGPFPYGSLAITQGPGEDSQGWPGLIYLSSLSFLSPEERAHMHVGTYGELLYSRIAPAHETAHQWWGDLLIWKSYREQWLVEALSNYCALLMLEEQDPAAFREAMERYRHDLVEKTKDGRTYSDAGPVTLGTRLISSKFPDAYDIVAYERGTWLFHMLRCMLRDGGSPVEADVGSRAAVPGIFFSVLHGLRQRFEGREINTRDVQQAFEDALPDTLRYENHKSLEWFFDGWVNGTAVPKLELSGLRMATQGSNISVSGKIQQKDAGKELVTSVPLYAEVPGRKLVFLGRVFAEGSETPFHFTAPPLTHKILLDPFATVLSRP
jgi:hypothetical protein